MTETAGNQQPVMGNESAPAMDAKPNANQSTLTADELQKELETVRKALKDANKEAETRRKKLDEYEAKEKEAETAKLSEMEKLQKKLADIETEKSNVLKTANNRLIAAEIKSKSDKFIDPDVVLAMTDKSKITVKEDGTIEGVDALLDDLAKLKPHLLKGSGSKLGATNPGFNATTDETRAQKHARLEGHNVDVFSSGGGVFWGEPPKE